MPETSYSVDLDEYRLRALLEFLDKDETLISHFVHNTNNLSSVSGCILYSTS